MMGLRNPSKKETKIPAAMNNPQRYVDEHQEKFPSEYFASLARESC